MQVPRQRLFQHPLGLQGKDLFRRGVLSEAVLALEAEVQRAPRNVDAWRLLGTVHAENDDDVQVRTENVSRIIIQVFQRLYDA